MVNVFVYLQEHLSFRLRCPCSFIIKIYFTKFNSICCAGWNTKNLCHKFNSQGPALRILGLRVASSKSQGPSSRVLGVKVPCRMVPVQSPGCHDPVSQGPWSQVSGSQSPGSKALRSQVLILGYALIE